MSLFIRTLIWTFC